jgi:hypothetical protein
MTDSQYLDKALDFIVEQEKENDYICTRLHEIPEEYEICVGHKRVKENAVILASVNGLKSLENV